MKRFCLIKYTLYFNYFPSTKSSNFHPVNKQTMQGNLYLKEIKWNNMSIFFWNSNIYPEFHHNYL